MSFLDILRGRMGVAQIDGLSSGADPAVDAVVDDIGSSPIMVASRTQDPPGLSRPSDYGSDATDFGWGKRAEF